MIPLCKSEQSELRERERGKESVSEGKHSVRGRRRLGQRDEGVRERRGEGVRERRGERE